MDDRWSTLPEHLLDLIVQRLSLPDLFRFGCVCKPWRSVCGILQFRNHLPWLLHPHQGCTTSSPGRMAFDNKDVGFYSLCDEKIYKAEIPELSNRRICGSFPGGWLMTVHHNSRVQLFNPFFLKSSVVHLPPLSKFPRSVNRFYDGTSLYHCGSIRFSSSYMQNIHVHKVAMSGLSMTSGTMIVAIKGLECSLVFCTIGQNQQEWTPLTNHDEQNFGFDDLAYYKGKFYAVRGRGREVVVVLGLDTKKNLPYVVQVARLPIELADEYYILESSGELLVVLRSIIKDKYRDKTAGFKILKLEFGTSNKLVEIHSLGDRSLFLGYNSSFSISSSDFSGCKPNCIYFTDNFDYFSDQNGYGGHDQGIFNLEDGSIEKFLYPTDNVIVMPPVWFAPNRSC